MKTLGNEGPAAGVGGEQAIPLSKRRATGVRAFLFAQHPLFEHVERLAVQRESFAKPHSLARTVRERSAWVIRPRGA